MTTISRCCSCHRHFVHSDVLQENTAAFQMLTQRIPETKYMKLFIALNWPSVFSYQNLASSCPLIPPKAHDIFLCITIFSLNEVTILSPPKTILQCKEIKFLKSEDLCGTLQLIFWHFSYNPIFIYFEWLQHLLKSEGTDWYSHAYM